MDYAKNDEQESQVQGSVHSIIKNIAFCTYKTFFLVIVNAQKFQKQFRYKRRCRNVLASNMNHEADKVIERLQSRVQHWNKIRLVWYTIS